MFSSPEPITTGAILFLYMRTGANLLLFMHIGAILLLNNSSDLKQPSVQEKEEFNEYRQKSYQAQVTFSLFC